jgi:hypothetical protein
MKSRGTTWKANMWIGTKDAIGRNGTAVEKNQMRAEQPSMMRRTAATHQF